MDVAAKHFSEAALIIANEASKLAKKPASLTEKIAEEKENAAKRVIEAAEEEEDSANHQRVLKTGRRTRPVELSNPVISEKKMIKY